MVAGRTRIQSFSPRLKSDFVTGLSKPNRLQPCLDTANYNELRMSADLNLQGFIVKLLKKNITEGCNQVTVFHGDNLYTDYKVSISYTNSDI